MSGEKHAIIFGASGGIGRVVSERLHNKGWTLTLVGRNEATLQDIIPGAKIVVANGVKSEEVEQVFLSSPNASAVVNCIGSILLKPAHLTSEADFRSVFETNLLSAFNCVRSAGKFFTEGSSVVLVSSCAARIGLANHEAIAAAKAGIEGLVRSAAATYAAKRIRFNAVAPGLTKTPLSQKITANAQAAAFSTALHPLGRLGEPDDIAAAIEFLVEKDSSWITGQIISVDGGLSSIKNRVE